MKQKEPIAGRVDPEIKRYIEQIATEAGVTESEIVRRATRNYVRANPDGYDAVRQKITVDQIMEDLES